ncbi:hypothetical protein LIER_28162 [Lithospermum erythrorhizon]|uniref:Retrotransposon gag domain-containing protein n=1 Tax=Lithospermum erythrorhizon TaxID=34254 RepID=A0AAV3RG96_LITER
MEIFMKRNVRRGVRARRVRSEEPVVGAGEHLLSHQLRVVLINNTRQRAKVRGYRLLHLRINQTQLRLPLISFDCMWNCRQRSLTVSLRDPSKFCGANSSIRALEFISDLEAIFEPMGIEGELRVKFAIYKFHGEACAWSTNVSRSMIDTRQVPVMWDRFVDVFNKKYCLRTHMSVLERELVQIRQDGRTINEYEKRFSEFCRLLPDAFTNEKKKMDRFRSRLSLMVFVSFSEMLDAALQAESEHDRVLSSS